MKYKYKARNQAGAVQEGIVEASTFHNATGVLQQHNLVVVSIESRKESGIASESFPHLGRSVRQRNSSFFPGNWR